MADAATPPYTVGRRPRVFVSRFAFDSRYDRTAPPIAPIKRNARMPEANGWLRIHASNFSIEPSRRSSESGDSSAKSFQKSQ